MAQHISNARSKTENSSARTLAQQWTRHSGQYVRSAFVCFQVFRGVNFSHFLSQVCFSARFSLSPHKPQPDCNTTEPWTRRNRSELHHIHKKTPSLSVRSSFWLLPLLFFIRHPSLCPLLLFSTFCLTAPSSVFRSDSCSLFFFLVYWQSALPQPQSSK